MNIILDNKNALLKRREIKAIVEADSNPGFENSTSLIANQFKSKPENIVLKNVKSKFGRNTFLIDAYIYDSEEAKEAIETKIKNKEAKK